MSKLSDNIAIAKKAIYDCEAISVDGKYVVPVSLCTTSNVLQGMCMGRTGCYALHEVIVEEED